jgi:hypothetical protein
VIIYTNTNPLSRRHEKFDALGGFAPAINGGVHPRPAGRLQSFGALLSRTYLQIYLTFGFPFIFPKPLIALFDIGPQVSNISNMLAELTDK